MKTARPENVLTDGETERLPRLFAYLCHLAMYVAYCLLMSLRQVEHMTDLAV